MKCPTCGAENEASNRFCEQCGSRITPSGGFQPAAADLAALPTAAAATCPTCGAAVLPGEAFCDECGASLTGVAPAAAPAARNDAPTIVAPPASSGGAPASDQGVVCPACGHQNLPGDSFCDNCGAALDQAPARSAPSADAPTMLAEPQAEPAAANPPADPLAATVEQPALTPDDAPAPDQAASAPPATTAPSSNSAPTAEAPAIVPSPEPAGSAQADYEAAQQRLNDEIGRQQKIIEQFEQMQAMFGANAPAAVTQGLADARDAKSRAEAELTALPPPAPALDPAELARLNDEIGRQQKIIEQFEQMQAMFGANAPAAVTQGLADARDAKSRAEAELAALTGGAGPAQSVAPAEPAATAPSEPPAAAPAVPAATMPTVDEAVPPVQQAAPAVSPAGAPDTSTAPPAAAAPRLVFADGDEIALPAEKREIIIGRDDPISGIFPEVDLTPHGGESGGVSRRHARLNHDDGQWTITDLDSTNYTRVDGAKIDPNVAVPIGSGAKLQFGRVAMTFEI